MDSPEFDDHNSEIERERAFLRRLNDERDQAASRSNQEVLLVALIILFIWILGLYYVNAGSFNNLREAITWNRADAVIVSSETFEAHISTCRKGKVTSRPALVTQSVYEFSINGESFKGNVPCGSEGENVEVLYDRQDPTKNKPAHSAEGVLKECAFAICFDLFSLVAAVWIARKLFRYFVKSQSHEKI